MFLVSRLVVPDDPIARTASRIYAYAGRPSISGRILDRGLFFSQRAVVCIGIEVLLRPRTEVSGGQAVV